MSFGVVFCCLNLSISQVEHFNHTFTSLNPMRELTKQLKKARIRNRYNQIPHSVQLYQIGRVVTDSFLVVNKQQICRPGHTLHILISTFLSIF